MAAMNVIRNDILKNVYLKPAAIEIPKPKPYYALQLHTVSADYEINKS